MGRPIKKKYFGNLEGKVGGKSVNTVVINNSGTDYATSATLNLKFTTPQLKDGVAPVVTAQTNGSGNITSVSIVNHGSGYLRTPTATVATPTTGTNATFGVTMNTGVPVLQFKSYLTTGTSAITGGDIVKQSASKKYLVQNDQGQGVCKLVASDVLTPGTMNLIATDYSGATYFVTKLTARKASLINRTNTSTSLVPLISDGTVTTGRTGWTLGAATGTIVTIANA